MARGNAVVGQAGGPTAVVNQSLVGIIEESFRHGHIDHLWGARHGVEGIVRDQFYDLKRQPRQILDLVANTPGAALGSTRTNPDEEYCARVLEALRRRDVAWLFYIGGNDSAEACRRLSRIAGDMKYDLRLIHIPKTIDNDLLANDHCPGYGSAARFVASAFIGDDLDNRALPGVKINILMGRNAGFLTAASVLARFREDDGPHLVYVPERPFTLERFLRDVCAALDRYGRCLVAVSEGIRDEQGNSWVEKVSVLRGSELERDAFGNRQLAAGTGSLADYLAGLIRHECAQVRRVRAETYGYMQRSFPACISHVDAWEARLVGQMAVSYSIDAEFDGSVALIRLPGSRYAVGTRFVPLSAVAPDQPPKTRTLDDQYISEEGNNVLNTYRQYVRPLVGDLPRVGWFEQIHETKVWH